MRVEADGLRLDVSPLSRFDGSGDARIVLGFSVPDVSGSYNSWIRRADLDVFISDLQQMSAGLVQGSTARLATWEADYLIELTLDGLGHIGGRYTLAPGVANESRVTVTGRFKLDQSYLPALIDDLQQLRNELSCDPSL